LHQAHLLNTYKMTHKNILHIDDDADDCEMFEQALKEVSQAIYTSMSNPLKALQKLLAGKIKPDMIILDYNMPGLNGMDLLSQLKKNNKVADIPVIMLSTSSREDFKAKAIELGAVNYITKPSSFTELKSIIRTIL